MGDAPVGEVDVLAGPQSGGHASHPQPEAGQPGGAVPQFGRIDLSQQPDGYPAARADARGLSPGTDRPVDPPIDRGAVHGLHLLYPGADGVRR